MYQIFITPEAIEHMGIAGLTKVLLSHIREGEEIGYSAFTIISLVGVSNLQLGNILKPVFHKTKASLIVMSHIAREKLPELLEDSEVVTRYLDVEFSQN